MNRRFAFFLILLFFCLAPSCLAEQEADQASDQVEWFDVKGIEYGAWSEWQEAVVQAAPGLEVESKAATTTAETVIWRYSRYEYFNETAGRKYAAPEEITGDFVREGSGKWTTKEVREQLPLVSTDGEQLQYEGGWFNEEEERTPSTSIGPMYRYRELTPITCRATAAEILMLPNDVRHIDVDLGGSQTQYTYIIDDNNVAYVDSAGNIHAVGGGWTKLRVRAGTKREMAIDVMVCKKNVPIPSGTYTFRLVGTRKALDVGSGLGGKRRASIISDYRGGLAQRFTVKKINRTVFDIRPTARASWRLDVKNNKNGKADQYSEVRLAAAKNPKQQRFHAISVPDGSYILLPRSNTKMTVGVASRTGGKLSIKPYVDQLDQLDRWLVIPARTKEKSGKKPSFEAPVVRDGKTVVQTGFGANNGHEGMVFDSSAERVYVLAAAQGRVIEANDTCRHDEPKSADKAGHVIDPCSPESSLGNYVVIDHGGGVTATYAHLSRVDISVGDYVYQGEIIGRSGATGSTQSVNLYFAMRLGDNAVDPRSYIKLPEIGVAIE